MIGGLRTKGNNGGGVRNNDSIRVANMNLRARYWPRT